MSGLYKRIYKIINDNHIWADIESTDDTDDYGFAEITVDGDWKHDHARLKYLLNQAFDTVIWKQKSSVPSDSDNYEATYMVYLADPKEPYTESKSRRKESLRRVKTGKRLRKESAFVDDIYIYETRASRNMEDDLRGLYLDDSINELRDELADEGFRVQDSGNCILPKDAKYIEFVNDEFKVTAYYGRDDLIVSGIYVKASYKR